METNYSIGINFNKKLKIVMVDDAERLEINFNCELARYHFNVINKFKQNNKLIRSVVYKIIRKYVYAEFSSDPRDRMDYDLSRRIQYIIGDFSKYECVSCGLYVVFEDNIEMLNMDGLCLYCWIFSAFVNSIEYGVFDKYVNLNLYGIAGMDKNKRNVELDMRRHNYYCMIYNIFNPNLVRFLVFVVINNRFRKCKKISLPNELLNYIFENELYII